ncbi:MAG: PRC-barrel domain-containing protein [Hyphomicrobiales bacterium]|nr:PRC-barrel domain-containing protein [Hyphomicrobiales bacterium]
MIRTLLATTTIAALLTTGAALAQTTTPDTTAPDTAVPSAPATQPTEPANPPGMKSADEVKAKDEAQTDGHLASNLMGASVYNSAGDKGQEIGNVNDLVLDKDGKIVSVVVGVGGFLGIGSKNVAIDYSQVKWEQGNGKWWVIVPTTADQLKALPDFDPKPYQAEPAESNATGTGTTGTGMGAPTTPAPSTEGSTSGSGG